MSSRPKIPQQVADELMYRNRHTCSVCRTPRKHVQIHHIDGNNVNIRYSNLAVLCLDCHSLVTGDEGLGRQFTPGEVSRYKADWEQICTGVNAEEEEEDDEEEEDIDQPADHHYESSILQADVHMQYPYKLEEDDSLALWMESDEPLTIVIINSSDYDRWNQGRTVDLHAIHEDAYELNITFEAPQQGEYSVIMANFGEEDANVQLDISVWG